MSANKRDEILGIMLPDQNNAYLLPNVSIAEIFTLDEVGLFEEKSPTHPGVIGQVEWRQSFITLLHLNEFISKEHLIYNPKSLEKARVAVINPISKPELPFYAVLTTKTPRLTRINPSDFNESKSSALDIVSLEVKLKNEKCFIPDLKYLESIARENQKIMKGG
ncbi:MAG TPA: hypothetical protein DHW71_02660 [Gammaproteobacteria bacterium]|nr:hypothetical protein [Gammaproteobacteria bacterium]MEC8011797.1 hypothetical protein [Pseudomonadota bacterium]HBF06837.1 hypothetical protein [Gammaproteobacteria bacterium]HCK91857.1 hypothetical protein [Gammaproteobacteria bacterium]|tara:strand:+ start:31972 stop:32463 length:492 start_codon:yes stop_codon:yes gene_type:complete